MQSYFDGINLEIFTPKDAIEGVKYATNMEDAAIQNVTIAPNAWVMMWLENENLFSSSFNWSMTADDAVPYCVMEKVYVEG